MACCGKRHDRLLDGTIDRNTYRDRQTTGRLRLAQLRDQVADIPDPTTIAQRRRDFLELVKTLVSLYEIADPAEKREIVQNAFSNRRIAGKNVELEPYDWLARRESMLSVFQCDPERHRDTNSPGVPAGVHGLERLIALLKR